MHELAIIMHVTDYIFIDYAHITLIKLQVKFQSDPFEQRWKNEKNK